MSVGAATGFVVAPLASLDEATRARLTSRSDAVTPAIAERVSGILARVRRDGDQALAALTRELDGATPESFEVPGQQVAAALERTPEALRQALESAARNIAIVHRALLPRAVEVEVTRDLWVGRRPDPLARVGIYAPGGRARYPSSVLMGAIPAQVAGVPEIVLCSPPGRDGTPSELVLAAAAIAGVHRVFALGGAQAIAAMAFGTESVPRVERIVGPGNAWVAEAKRQVAGTVPVDAPAGPSELLVITDTPDEDIALELVAQAEHDPLAAAIAIVIGDADGAAPPARAAEGRARALAGRLAEVAAGAPRRAIVEEALAARGAVLWCDALDEALAFASAYAPEHLLLAIRQPERALGRVRHAGTVFLGIDSSVVFGDYATGANHTLPTGGAAQAWSGLSTEHFVRWTTWQQVGPRAVPALAGTACALAEAEGLESHAAAARRALARHTAPWDRPDSNLLIVPRARSPRPEYADLTPYAAERAADPPAPLDLSDNTSRFGTAPAAWRAFGACDGEVVARYPSQEIELRAALARHAGVPPACVTVGCGSDDLLDATFRALVAPGGHVAFGVPTFSMVPRFARANGLETIEIPPRGDGSLDVDALLASDADLVYVASPDNPTGRVHGPDALRHLIARARGIVVLDHAYVEFGGDDFTPEVSRHDHLVVTRTMSKAFGLAGLRVGWAVADSRLIGEIDKARGPFMVSAPAERAALAALDADVPWMRERVAEAREARDRLAAALVALGFAPLPSGANFLLVPVGAAALAAAELHARGVAVRAFTALPGVGDALRITVAPWPEMEPLLAAWAEVVPCV